jgi:hypothetical protein
MNIKHAVIGILAAGCFIAMSILMPSLGNAQADPKITKAMADLKDATAKLGAAKLDGKEAVSGKDASALYFAHHQD